MMDLVIAIPAFNEQGTVGAVVTGARAHGRVIVIDDGSTDDTATCARAAGAEVIRHRQRQGKGAALSTAFATARTWGAERVLTLDADAQHDPDDIPILLAAAETTADALVIGSRVSDGATLPRGRGLAVRVAGFWLNWIAGTAVADTQSGFRVYPLRLFDDVAPRGGRFVFETAVLVEALRRGWRVSEVPIRAVPYAPRPSRLRPISDGAAITGYLVTRSLARWGTEIVSAAREVASVFASGRRRTRHARMLMRVSTHAGAPTWGPALGIAAAGEIRDGVTSWWHHPRFRRARAAAVATVASPALLLLTAVAALTGPRALGVLDRLVSAVYDQRRLPALDASGTVTTDPAWVEI
jgi:hypothetical protein